MTVDPAVESDDAIAIVGIGGLFPGAETLDQFWASIREGIDSVSDVPAGRWLVDPAQAFDLRIGREDHVYSTRAGSVTLPHVDAEGFDLDGRSLEGLDPVFRLALFVAREAWRDSKTDKVDRSRVGVVFGNIVVPTETASAWGREVLGAAFEEGLVLPQTSID